MIGICLPGRVESAQMVEAVLEVLSQGPEKGEQEAGELIWETLRVQYPCDE
ncbi:hypothetical protein SAMN04488011_102168 [Palleronia pelagia]|uniref:Rap1a immunity protein domain-containing protein n=2 Tax=Palleronia pelagia TaxID=387096 RepID=A0A1H8D404_9RHOB|nr:hypothetical protein SAMN04488011_102168 [Palleronia pelagia]